MATYAGKLKVDGTELPIGSTLYGTCDTAAATAAKVVTMANFDELLTGVTIHVKFTNTNSVANPTLNVNSTGAKNIYRYGTTAPNTSASWSWYAGAVVSFTYDGSAWIMNDMIGNDNTYEREYWNATIKAVTAITAGTLICGTSAGWKMVAKGIAFDIAYPVLYMGTAMAANRTRSDPYPSISFNATASNGGTSPAFTTYAAVFLKGKLVGSTFTIDSSTLFTCAVPTTADGFQYYQVGVAYSATNMRLIREHKIFEYSNGSFHEVAEYAWDAAKVNGHTVGVNVPSNAVFTDTNTHYTTRLHAGTGTAANAATTNGNTKLAISDDNTVRTTVTLKGSGATTVTSDSAGVITISSTDTNTNTDTLVTQTNTTASADYRVLFSATADDTTRTETARKNASLKYNPSTGNLQATMLNGVTIGSSPKFTDTNTHYTTHFYAGSGTAANAATTNGNTKLTVADDSTVRNSVTIKGANSNTVSSDASGTVTVDSIIASKTYSNLLASSNTNGNGADFIFATLTPADGTSHWRFKIEMEAHYTRSNDSVVYSQKFLWEMCGYGNTPVTQHNFRSLRNTSYRPFRYAILYRSGTATHAMYAGITLYDSNNNTTSGNARTVTFKVLELENLTVSLNNSPANTDYATFYTGNSMSTRTTYNAGDNGLDESGDSDTVHWQRMNNTTYKAAEALYRYQILFTKNETHLVPASSGNNNTANNKTITTSTFDPFGPIYYYNSTTAVAVNGNISGSALYQQLNINLYYAFNCNGTLTNQKAVYAVGVPQSGGGVKLHTTPLSQTLPTSDDGLVYIYLGLATSTGNIELSLEHPVYCFRGGHLQEYTGNIYAEDVTTTTTEADLFSDLQYNNMITTVTLAPGNWSSSAPYTQTVGVSGMRATAHPFFWLADTNSAAVANAFYYIDIMTTANGSVTFKCLSSKPTVSIPVMIKGK